MRTDLPTLVLASSVALLLAPGCSRPLPPPRPQAVSPASVQQGQPVQVAIHGTDFLPGVVADYGDPQGSVMDARFQLFLGSVPLEEVRLVSSTLLEARVPAGLPSGPHDLRVLAPHGAEGMLPAAFSVEPVPVQPPSQLAFLSAPQTVLVGACSQAVTLQLQDPSGAPVTAAEPTALSVTLTPAGALSFWADPACATPLVAPEVPAGQSQATLYFRGAAPQEVLLAVSAPDLPAVQQPQQVIASGTTLAWGPLPTTVRRGAELEVTLSVLDSSGGPVATFGGSATLSVLGDTSLLCVRGCGDAEQTLAFEDGVWQGVVRLGTPVGPGTRLLATSGPLEATSGALEVVDPPATPPVARLVRSPAVILAGGTVTLDGSGSTAWGAGGLSFAWDPLGEGGLAPPWSGWSSATSLSFSYLVPGRYRARLAVRDALGAVDLAEVDVRVIDPSIELCVVTRPDGADDGAADCSATDLSLPEALRLSNSRPGPQVITFQEGLALTLGGATLPVTDTAEVIGTTGVTLTDARWSVRGGKVWLSSLHHRDGDGASPLELEGGAVTLSRSSFHGFGPVKLFVGDLEVEGTRFVDCHGACVEINLGAGNFLLSHSFLESPGGNGVSLEDCGGPRRELRSSVFTRMNKGVVLRNNCGSGAVVVTHNTFHQLQIGVALEAGGGHVLVNNIFSENDAEPLRGCELSFAQRSHALISNSGADPCTHLDPGALVADPLFVDAYNDDYRLQAPSPARDSGLLLDATWTPLSYLGMAPDRGGRETW